MHQDEASLAALIGSRICHDLINPIGAISNGLELVGMGGAAPDGPEMSLIQQSCDNATARIRFFRIAFGSAGDIRPVSAAEACKTLADHYTGTRIKAEWQVTQDLRRDVTQLGYLCVLCLETALPQGGVVSVDLSGGALAVSAQADTVRAEGALWDLLTAPGAAPSTELRPADVQFGLLARLCCDLGITPELGRDANHAHLRIALPHP